MSLLIVAGLAAASYALREVHLPGLNPLVLDDFQGWVHNHDATSWLWQPGEGMSIAALGISPYVVASVVLQLICVLARHVGAAAVREVTSTRIDRAAMIGAVLVGLYHGWSLVVFQEGFVWARRPIVASPGWGFRVVAICAMVAGSMLLVMLARLVTRLARVNGVAVLIALGAARTILRSTSQATTDAPPLLLLASVGLGVGLAGFLLWFWRRIPLRDARGRAGAPFLTLSLGAAGGTPIIVAGFLVAHVAWSARTAHLRVSSGWLAPAGFPYHAMEVAVCVAIAIAWPFLFQFAARTAEGLREAGLFVPGVRPGLDTEDRAGRQWIRLLPLSAIVLVGLAVAAPLLLRGFDRTVTALAALGGGSLLIMVALCFDARVALRPAASIASPMEPTAHPADDGGRCPVCLHEVADGFAVCWSCGRAVAPISPLPLPLWLPEAPPEGGAPVTVARLAFPIDAELARLKLEAEGIPVRLLDRHIVLANWFLGVAFGGIRVQVPEECEPAAREMLFPPESTARAG